MEGAMTQAVLESKYDLTQFVADVRRITAQIPDDREKLAQLRPLIKKVVAESSWLPPAYTQLNPNGRAALYTLHEEADHTLALFAVVWPPGHNKTPPHNHGTWALVAGIRGVEQNVWWKRLDDGSQPGYAEVEQVWTQGVGAGDVIVFLPDDIHSVRNDGSEPTISLHLYGLHTNYTDRYAFDPEQRTAFPYKISPLA
jgi:predicted metal-dependent enzyme (double-stranded beta helix superfamily)